MIDTFAPPWPFLDALRMHANSYAAAYGAPVWLVGGGLTQKWPNDIDVRIVVENADWERLFVGKMLPDEADSGALSPAWWWRRARENLKQSRRLSRLMGYRIDFQIQTVGEAKKYKDAPRFRLDQASDDFFLAGVNDA